MLENKSYANGQKVYELTGDRLTYYFKNGTVRAEGMYKDGLMEGDWKFYRGTGELWQIGNFINSKKNGTWIRYDRNGAIEYEENFKNDKKAKKGK